MTTSVIICSFNGQQTLARAVAAVLESLQRSGGGQLVLVDSASTDGTAELMRSVGGDSASVITVTETGKALALNAGLEIATGDAVLFTDDDVLVPTNWVAVLSEAVSSGNHIVAGAVHLDPSLADGLFDYQREFLADTRYMNLGSGVPRTVVGASMALRGDLHELGFRFDPHLGPGALGFMEESLLYEQVSEAGGRGLLVESAPVLHCPAMRRFTPAMWRQRAFRQGASEAYIAHHWLHDRPTLRECKQMVGSEVRRFVRSRETINREALMVEQRRGFAAWYARHLVDQRLYARREVPARL